MKETTNGLESISLISMEFRLKVATSATREPWQALVAYVPDISVALRNQITGNFGGPAYIIGKNTVVLFWLPVSRNIVSN